MRGAGQIAELADIAQPDVGVVVNVGPVHLELLGSLEAIAAAKAELIVGLAPGATAIVPAHDTLLAPHLRTDVETITFGDGGDVSIVGGDGPLVTIDARGDRLELELPFTQAYHRLNLLAAVAAAVAIGVRPEGRLEVAFSPLRGERVELADGTVVVNDCYNANPMSMRAALDELAGAETGRRVAVLGDMLDARPRRAGLPRGDRSPRRRPRRGRARHRRPARRRHGRRLRRRGLPGRHRRRGRGAPSRGAPARRRRAGQGIARRRARGRRRGAPPSASGPDAWVRCSSPVPPPCSSASSCRRSSWRSCANQAGRRFMRTPAPRRPARRQPCRRWAAFLILVHRDRNHARARRAEAAVAGGVRGGGGVRGARLRRRLDEDHQAPLARPAGADEAAGHDRDLGRPVSSRRRGRQEPRCCACGWSTTQIDLGIFYVVFVLPGGGGGGGG